MKLKTSADLFRYGVIGYADFTLSIRRAWGPRANTFGATWRHVTLGLRSPVVRQPGRLYRDGRARYTWHPLRFGWGGGNLYLGVVYIVTTFGSHGFPPLRYAGWGPFQWAWQPTMAEYLKGGGP